MPCLVDIHERLPPYWRSRERGEVEIGSWRSWVRGTAVRIQYVWEEEIKINLKTQQNQVWVITAGFVYRYLALNFIFMLVAHDWCSVNWNIFQTLIFFKKKLPFHLCSFNLYVFFQITTSRKQCSKTFTFFGIN